MDLVERLRKWAGREPVYEGEKLYARAADEILRLREMIDKIARIPGVGDLAGAGDGSVHDAVVQLYREKVSAESERDALRGDNGDRPWRVK